MDYGRVWAMKITNTEDWDWDWMGTFSFGGTYNHKMIINNVSLYICFTHPHDWDRA